MPQLLHPYPAVDWAAGGSFGGSQSRSASAIIRKCGCGVIAMTDLVLYLTRYHGCAAPAQVAALAQTDPIPAEAYDRCSRSLQLAYLPMMPPFGINGLVLTGGIEAYCRLHRLPFHARWNPSRQALWNRMAESLRRDLPVILAIGPTLPALWQKHRLKLYRKSGHTYTAVTSAKAHYVTVTAMDDQWLQISSWGKQYYIHRQEFVEFGERHSTFLIHNILTLEPI